MSEEYPAPQEARIDNFATTADAVGQPEPSVEEVSPAQLVARIDELAAENEQLRADLAKYHIDSGVAGRT